MLVLTLSSLYSVQDPVYPMSVFCPCWGWCFWPQLNNSGNTITDYPRGFFSKVLQILSRWQGANSSLLSCQSQHLWDIYLKFICLYNSPCVFFSGKTMTHDTCTCCCLCAAPSSNISISCSPSTFCPAKRLASVLSSLLYTGHGDSGGMVLPIHGGSSLLRYESLATPL